MEENKEITQQNFERIEAFLLNKMTANEQHDFENELNRDPALAKEVATQRELMLAVETGEMKNKLDTIHQKITKKNGNTKWYLVAASIAVLLAIGIWTLNRPDKAERLFASNMTIDPGLPVPMSATNNYVFYDAMVDYKSGKYALAIIKWEPLLAQNPESDTVNYYLGVANFNNENFQKAIPYFEKVTQQENSTFYGLGEWYLALSFLATKDVERLNTLAKNSRSDYADRINELIQKIE